MRNTALHNMAELSMSQALAVGTDTVQGLITDLESIRDSLRDRFALAGMSGPQRFQVEYAISHMFHRVCMGGRNVRQVYVGIGHMQHGFFAVCWLCCTNPLTHVRRCAADPSRVRGARAAAVGAHVLQSTGPARVRVVRPGKRALHPQHCVCSICSPSHCWP